MSYPAWNIHLSSPDGATPLRCTTDSADSSKMAGYNDTGGGGGRTANMYIDIQDGFKIGGLFTWAGYQYKALTITYGPYSSSYNLYTDIPGCSAGKNSPDIPSPIGSIDIEAVNTGKTATTDETQVNIQAGSSNIRLSIPMYNITDIQTKLKPSDQGYVPVSKTLLTETDITELNNCLDGKGLTPSSINNVFLYGNQIVYYRDPEHGCVFVPTMGVAVEKGVNAPTNTPSRGKGQYQLIMRSIMSNNPYQLILPNNGGTANVSSAVLRKVVDSKADIPPPDAGIPVVVLDENGNRVKVTDSFESKTPSKFPISVKKVLIFLITAMLTLSVFVFLPNSPSNNQSLINSVVMLGISVVLSIITSINEISSRGKVVEGTPWFSWISLVEFVIFGIAFVIFIGAFMYTSSSNPYHLTSYFIFGFIGILSFILFGITLYVPFTSKETYTTQAQTSPLYYDSALSMTKTVIPFIMFILFTGNSPILNMLYDITQVGKNLPTEISPSMKFAKTNEKLYNNLVDVFQYGDKAKFSPLEFAQYPVKELNKSLLEIKPPSGIPNPDDWKKVLAAATTDNMIMMVKELGDNKTSKVLVDPSKGDKYLDGLDPSTLLKRPSFENSSEYTPYWYNGITVVLTIFFAIAFTLPLIYKNKEREVDPEQETSWMDVTMDIGYGILLPIFMTIMIWSYNSVYQLTSIQKILFTLGFVIPAIVNGLNGIFQMKR